MAAERKFSFAEIVQGRDASVRVTDDLMLVAIDLAMVVTGKDRDHAGQALRGISEEMFSSLKFSERKFPGKGNAHTKVVSFHNAIELIMVLPGKIAKETRSKFADIIRRYLGGDKTLITEIEANAASDSPIAQLARASMAPPTAMAEIPTEEMLEDRRRKREREDLEIKAMDTDIQSKRLSNVRLFADTMSLLNPIWADDARLRLQTEDWLKNIAFNSGTPAITNGGAEVNKSISVSQVAQEMGVRLTHGQLVQIGSAVARKYREKYNAEPPKHSQWVDGAERKVNSYTERDRTMVVDALRETGAL